MDTILSRKRTVVLALVFILLAGGFSYYTIPKESNPDISIPFIYALGTRSALLVGIAIPGSFLAGIIIEVKKPDEGPPAGAELDEGVQSIDIVSQLRDWLPESGIDFSRVKLEFRGEDGEQQAAMDFLSKAFVVAVFFIAIILVTQFNSFFQSALILTAVLFSTVGVFIGLLVTHQPFGIVMNGIGVIALAGIVVNNNIVLIDTYNYHHAHLGDSTRAALLTAAQRLRPVMLTTVTTILGLIPMVLGINIDFFTPHVSVGAPSTQWWTQLATSVSFGLAFATLLTLVLTPSLLAWEGRLKQRRTQPATDSAPSPTSP